MAHGVRRTTNSGRSSRIWIAAFTLALLAAPVAAATQAAAAGTATVVVNGALSPQVLTVGVGTTVTWQLADRSKHRIQSTSDTVGFDSGGIGPGGSFSFTFGSVGTYPYVDDENKNSAAYHGSIVVAASIPPGGGGGAVTSVPPATGITTVRIANRAFSPASISIATGSTVAWTNNDTESHTVTANGGAFDSGTFGAGGSYTHTFGSPGTFSYLCDIHPSMVGVVSVSSPTPGGTLPPPPPPPPPPPTAAQPSGGITPAGSTAVRMVDFAFQPSTLTVSAGAIVTWTNAGQARHTVAAIDGSFHSPDVRSAEAYQHTFPTPGTYAYFCDIHPDMKATIAVRGPGGEPPPPANAATSPPLISAVGDVRIADFSFTPKTITVRAGASLTFVNAGAARHSATAQDGSFDTGLLVRGGTSRKMFKTPGTFPYFCTIHANMSGTILVTGAGGEPPPPPKDRAPVATAEGAIQMVDFEFSPAQITVAAGATVKFVNAGVAPHTATARDGSFDTGLLRSTATSGVVFATPGTFPYYCTIHPQMTGTVAVTGAGGEPPPPPKAGPAANNSKGFVKMMDSDFSIDRVTVYEGGSVGFLNVGTTSHTATAINGSFDTGPMQPGESYRVRFPKPGRVAFRCTLHPQMTGSVVVLSLATSKATESGFGPSGGQTLVLLVGLVVCLGAVAFVRQIRRTRLRSDPAALH